MPVPATEIIYYAMALDPIHVGTGGYRLGRVDLSIVREPGTNIPKIPGTSINGVTRAYSAMAAGRYDWSETRANPDGSQETVRFSCAGQGQPGQPGSGKEGHCGKHNCPVCVSFGFARGDNNSGTGFQGLAQFADARILFFPVHSMIGPVWITSPATLAEHGLNIVLDDSQKIRLVAGLTAPNGRLNLGWMMLSSEEGSFSLNDHLPGIPAPVKQRAVLVSEKLFSQLINDNLEVRTSVSIDPATGAAEDGALFTYEAIPRSAVLWFPVTYSNPALFRIDGRTPTPQVNDSPTNIRLVVENGLSLIRQMGIGGMNTRGMGRLKVLNLQTGGGNNES